MLCRRLEAFASLIAVPALTLFAGVGLGFGLGTVFSFL
jgi:hypothetical protein